MEDPILPGNVANNCVGRKKGSESEGEFPKIPNYTIRKRLKEESTENSYLKDVFLADKNVGHEEQPRAVKIYRKEDVHPKAQREIEYFGFREIVKKENNFLSRNQHPNIARYYDSGVVEEGRYEGCFYTSQEFVDGKTLREGLKELSTEDKIKIFGQLADAIGFVHENGYAFRDFSFGNYIITDDKRIKLIDFDTIVRIGTEMNIELENLRPKKYRAPEINRMHVDAGKYTIDKVTDMYGLGAVLYFMLKGEESDTLFNLGKLTEDEYRRKLDEEIKRLDFSGVDGFVGFCFKHVLKGLLEFDPEKRYQRVDECMQEIRRVEEIFRCGVKYSGRPVLGRLGTSEFIYGHLESVIIDEDEFAYVFNDVVMFDIFIPNPSQFATTEDAIAGEAIHNIANRHGFYRKPKWREILKRQRGKSGVIEINDNREAFLGEVIESKINKPYFLHVVEEDKRIEYGRIVINDGPPAHIIRGREIKEILPFAFDDSVEVYRGEVKFIIEEKQDGLLFDGVAFGWNDFFSFIGEGDNSSLVWVPLDKSKWVSINQLLKSG